MIFPGGIKNTFARHLVFWVLFLPLLSYILIPLVSDDMSIDKAEMAFVKSSVSDVNLISERTNHIFSSLFVKSGLVSTTENFFSGESVKSSRRDNNKAGLSGASWAGDWIHGVWAMIYKSIWRFVALVKIAFWPMLALAIAAIIDGFSTRAKKKFTFARSNQVFFYASTHTAVLIFGLFVFLPIIPIPLTAPVIAGFMAMLTVALWVATNNFQTGT